MKPKIDVIRALTFVVAKRAITFASVLAIVLSVILFAAIWVLAHFLSAWWWLLLILYLPCLIILLVALGIASIVTARLYPRALTGDQKVLFRGFADKIQRLLESRGMGWPIFAFLCAKDLLFYRELRTMKSLIADTTSLKRDFSALERSIKQE